MATQTQGQKKKEELVRHIDFITSTFNQSPADKFSKISHDVEALFAYREMLKAFQYPTEKDIISCEALVQKRFHILQENLRR